MLYAREIELRLLERIEEAMTLKKRPRPAERMSDPFQHPTREQVEASLADWEPHAAIAFACQLARSWLALEAENRRLRAAHDRPVEVAIAASLRLTEQAALLKQARGVLSDLTCSYPPHHEKWSGLLETTCKCSRCTAFLDGRLTVRAIDALNEDQEVAGQPGN